MSSKRAIRNRQCTGKARHATSENAAAARRIIVRAGRALPGALNVYACKFCKGFHVGHRPGSGGLRPS